MFGMNNGFYFILLSIIYSTYQNNLYYTDWTREKNNAVQYNCLRIANDNQMRDNQREVVSYCMNEFSPIFNVEKDVAFLKFTFLQLSQQNISSQQLYHWLASIDLIERYQFYLNKLSAWQDISLSTEVFYNCTLPRFGPICEYEFVYHHPNHPSLNEAIKDFYHNYDYNAMTDFTCYIHLQVIVDHLQYVYIGQKFVMVKLIVSMVTLMKKIVGNWKLINVKIMNIDVRMDNVSHNRSIRMLDLLLIVLMFLMKYLLTLKN